MKKGEETFGAHLFFTHTRREQQLPRYSFDRMFRFHEKNRRGRGRERERSEHARMPYGLILLLLLLFLFRRTFDLHVRSYKDPKYVTFASPRINKRGKRPGRTNATLYSHSNCPWLFIAQYEIDVDKC